MKRTPLIRRTPLRAKRERPRRRAEDDHLPIEWPDVRTTVFVRCGGRCELCDAQLSLRSMEAHHRRPRKAGPDCPGNTLALCGSCHHARVHSHPEDARANGWIVSRHTADPCQVPVELLAGRMLLTCDGRYV